MTTNISLGALDITGFSTTNEVVPASIPIDLRTDTWRTMLRLVLPVAAGDLISATAWTRTTNDAGYNVGVGQHLWWYDVDLPADQRVWHRFDEEAGSVGMNVTPDLHHLTLPVDVPLLVPAGWPPGHRMAVVVRADAHSTAWDRDGNGKADDSLTVDPCGRLTAWRCTPRTAL
ncbi:hypothetical protein [Streptomyces antibioticus]|uniref:hypothetical protein n=1 Tax=Streptomyces antibioticus TaxID=1890 RepID=UPI003F48595B